MWKKILLAALVLFLAATYVFNHNYNMMKSEEGEIVNIQTQMQSVTSRSHELAVETRDAVYAELRKEAFDAEASRLADEQSADESETDQVSAEITTLSTSLKEAEEELASLESDLKKLVEELSSAAGIESGSADISDIGETVIALASKLNTAEGELVQEETRISALTSEEERLSGEIADGRQINADRQARISPAELSCSVQTTDPNWSYVILDAGLDKGIVIGSRLAVMRDDVKICELNVTLVEKNRASGDVVYDTLLPGEQVQAGDKVKAVRN